MPQSSLAPLFTSDGAPSTNQFRLATVVLTQQAIAEAGHHLTQVMQIIVERMLEITSATGAVIEMAEDDEMVYKAVSGSVTPHLGVRLKQASSLSGHCVRTGEIINCEDTETDDRVDREACRRVGASSMVVVPLHHNKAVVGVLKVLSTRPQAFTREDIQSLQLMSSFLGNVLAQAEEFDAKQKLLAERTEALEALRESEARFRNSFAAAAIGKALVGVDGRFLQVNQSLCHLLGYSEAELLQLNFQQITHPDDLEVDMGKLQQLLAGEIETYQIEKRYFTKTHEVVWILLAVSLVRDSRQQPLYVIGEIQDITIQKQALELLRGANEHLKTLAHYDSLTGIGNRRAFDERLASEISRANATHQPLTVALLDVDRFKQYNDTHGHIAGDEVLATIARLLQGCLRPDDFVGRYGGEEFVLIFPATAPQDSVRIAERARRAIAENDWPLTPVTASFGLATLANEDAQTLLVKADLALYDAKANGRNKVRHAQESVL